MRYAKLDKNNKVVNLIKVEDRFLKEVKKELNLIKIDKGDDVSIGYTWNKETKTFFSPEIVEQEEKTIYDEIKELKEKINELSKNISIGS